MLDSTRITLRPMSGLDIAAGLRLCRASGWNQIEEDWRVFLQSPGSGAFLAESAGRVAGSVAFLRYGSFAWIAMMLVDPSSRRVGIGKQLMETVLIALREDGCIGLDATPMGEPLYRRFGFVGDYSLARMKTAVEPGRFGSLTGRARRLTGADLEDVLRRDREVFGGDRGGLLTSLFGRAPECAWIVKDRGGVRGYTFGRSGALYHQLGPVVALDGETARALLSHCFSELGGRSFAIDVPRLDAAWTGWLESVGFAVERPFVRMFRGGHTPPGAPALQYAITGPEFA